MKCPKCDAEMDAVEIDIGVGLQRHILGYECASCGENYGTCNGCGVTGAAAHPPWCPETQDV